jgi:hypothetical protein
MTFEQTERTKLNQPNIMNTRSFNDSWLDRNLWLRSTVAAAIAVCMALPLAGLGAVPTPVVNLKFTEPVGAFAVGNTGSLGGDAFFHQGDGTGYPELVGLVPQGPFAPAINVRSLDMGMIEAGQGDRALDLVTALGPSGTLGAFPDGFTLTGWINARTLTAGGGGNRILFALDAANGPGFDLVQLSDGSLQLGVNQWPDGSPARSSAGMVTANPELGAGNWLFFAVTYDHALEAGQVNFYFGKGDALAGLDVNRTYARGPVELTGELTLGNFGIVTEAIRSSLDNSRVFRGLIDEVKVFDTVLDLAQIQQVQVEGTVPTVPATISRQPESQTVFPGRTARFDVVASGSAPILYQWQTNGVDVVGATESALTLTGLTRAHDGLEVRVRVSNAGAELLSEAATLTVFTVTEGSLITSGMVLRLDASALELADGAPVAQWPDLSGMGNHAVQPDEAARPTFVAEGSDFGLPVIRFTAISPFQHLRVENMGPYDPPNTIFLVWKINESTGGDQQPLDGLSDPTRVRIGYQANPSRLFAWSGGAFPNLEKAITVPFEGLLLTVAVYDTAGGLFKVDGVLEDDRPTGSIPISGFTIGRRLTEAQALRGDIAEVIVYDRRLSESEIIQMEGYLLVKWLTEEGLDPGPVDLPVTITEHPQSLTVFEGQSASFNVVFEGTPPFRVQWQRNGLDIPGATGATYNLTASLADSGAQFRVVIGNDHGPDQTSQPATLTVLEESGHKVWVSFSEEVPPFANLGNLGGSGVVVATGGYPVVSANVPVGPQAPTGNTQSIDFGTILEGQGGRAIDFNDLFGGTMGPLAQFTITGWLNARDLSIGAGGNRIAFALAAANGPGFDLVHLADGSLQLGVNQWPDGADGGGPISSPGLVTADPDAGAANWIFVAVTYDGTATEQNAAFYRGTANQAAALDLVSSYNRGPIVTSGPLTLGNFGPVGVWRNHTGENGSVAGEQGSRVFRGLMDEIQVFNRVLSLAEIQEAQSAAVQVVVDRPRIEIMVEQGNVVISWEATSVFQLLVRDNLITGDWTPVAVAPTVEGNRYAVTLPVEAGVRFYQLRSP